MGGGLGQQSPPDRQSSVRVPSEEELQGSVLRDPGEGSEILREQVYS